MSGKKSAAQVERGRVTRIRFEERPDRVLEIEKTRGTPILRLLAADPYGIDETQFVAIVDEQARRGLIAALGGVCP